MNSDSQWSKREACFARATRVWLAVNHNTSVTSDECLKRIAREGELGSCQSNLCCSRGYERLQKSKDSLKLCFENVNLCYHVLNVRQVRLSIQRYHGRVWHSRHKCMLTQCIIEVTLRKMFIICYVQNCSWLRFSVWMKDDSDCAVCLYNSRRQIRRQHTFGPMHVLRRINGLIFRIAIERQLRHLRCCITSQVSLLAVQPQ